jgi:hypothetical protein
MPLVNPYVVGDNDRTIVNGIARPSRGGDAPAGHREPVAGGVVEGALSAVEGGEVFALAPEGGVSGADDWVGRLAHDQVALLERLAGGQTIAAAAAAEWMSLRTANRRVAELRAMLGLSSTREVVAAYVKTRRLP